MRIDAWIQHPSPEFVSAPIFASLLRWMGVTDTTAIQAIPLEFTIASMDEAQMDKALISAWYGPQGALISNEEVASQVAQYPDRLIGVGSVDLRYPMRAVEEVRRCVDEFGFRAIRVLPWLWDLPCDDRRYYPVYVACCELNIPFCLQVGHTGPLCPSEPGRPIPYLDHVALDFPELTLVGGHIGYPWTDEMISLATKYPNVYIDTSAYKSSRYPPSLVNYMRQHGRKKVLFGSNWPMVSPNACLEGLEALGLDKETKGLFLGQNASRIFLAPQC